MSILRRTPFWGVIIALTWVAAFALLQIANSYETDCQSPKGSLYLWSVVPFLLGFVEGVAGAILCRIKRRLFVVLAAASLGAAGLSVFYSFVHSICLS